MFKRRNKFVKDQYIKVWVWAESCEALIFAVTIGVQGDYVKVRYLDQEKMKFLKMRDNTFCFPENVHFKNCCHLAYDQQKQAMQLDNQNQDFT